MPYSRCRSALRWETPALVVGKGHPQPQNSLLQSIGQPYVMIRALCLCTILPAVSKQWRVSRVLLHQQITASSATEQERALV